jgi:membrane fusion protein (multidrug efflux system)
MMLMLAVVIAVVGILGFVKFRQVQAAMSQSWTPAPEAVTTVVAEPSSWPATLSAIGTVAAVRGVTISADLPGLVSAIHFESGKRVAAGEVLVELDSRQEQAQLTAAEADRDLKNLNLERAQDLSNQGVISKAEFDRADAEAKQAEAKVGEIRATIARKRIRAPFAGVLGIRQVNLGQYLNGGDPIVPLQALDPIYVNFSLPQQAVPQIKVGDAVHVRSEGIAGLEGSGKITAVNSVVDEATRNVQVQASFANPANQLRPGMFVTAEVLVGEGSPVIAIPASSISYAPYGDSVFIVEDITPKPAEGQKAEDAKPYKGVRQQFVKLGQSRGDLVAVLTGLKPGEEVVTSGVFKLRDGAAVQVNNARQPGSSAAPKPEDS